MDGAFEAVGAGHDGWFERVGVRWRANWVVRKEILQLGRGMVEWRMVMLDMLKM